MLFPEIFKSKITVQYNEKNINLREVLDFLHNKKNDELYSHIKIFKENNRLFLKKNNLTKTKNIFKKKINYLNNFTKINLLTPSISGDNRWKTMGVSSSSIFLASQLIKSGYECTAQRVDLSLDNFKSKKNTLYGITIYEDLIEGISQFCDLNKNNFIIAGGPCITLNPLQSLYQLKEIKLFIRGEAEFLLPKILNSIKKNSLSQILGHKGFTLNLPGLLILSNYDEIIRPRDFSSINFSFDFIDDKKLLKNGLEINFSRGCKRSCTFCSKVQGKEIRKLNIDKVDELLKKFISVSPQKQTHFININDDDILQDFDYSKAILQVMKKNDFKLYGIQSSINSFFNSDMSVNNKTIELIKKNKKIFYKEKPLLWLGTDAFIKERAHKLGKQLPPQKKIEELLTIFDNLKIPNYHYWISSDHNSDWKIFLKEFHFIFHLSINYKMFNLLAHAPFLIPYSSTPVYKYLKRKKSEQIEHKNILNAKSHYNFPLPLRVKTKSTALNYLLETKQNSNKNFFYSLKEKDFFQCFILIYQGIQEDIMGMNNHVKPKIIEELKITKQNCEDILIKLNQNKQ